MLSSGGESPGVDLLPRRQTGRSDSGKTGELEESPLLARYGPSL